MAEILTVGGVDLTAHIHGDSLQIEQAAGEFTAVCSFELDDRDCSLVVEKGQAVVVSDDSTIPATILFGGEVANVDADMPAHAAAGRRLAVQCQDYNIFVEEAVVDELEAYTNTADSTIIFDLFSKYRPDINAVGYVAGLGDLTIAFENVTLRQALADICGRTGGRWYVDEQKRLHYFDAESNVAAWSLSDRPDGLASFPYQELKRRENATPVVNQVLVVGDGITGWVEDAASVAKYDPRPAVVNDRRITTQPTAEARGNAILDRYAWPRISYDVTTRKDGLRAGMDVRLISHEWGLDETVTVRRLTLHWVANHRFYELELGDGVASAATGGRLWVDVLNQVQTSIIEIDGTIYDTDAPSAPGLLVGNLSSGVDVDADGHQVVYLQITWGSVADADLDHYQIQISTASDFAGYTITRDHAADGDRIERFVPVLGNTTYYARVRAIDWVGNASAWSDTRSITTARDTDAPAQVSGLSVAASRTLVGLQWTANSEADLAEYEIQRAPDSGGAPGAYVALAKARLNFYIDQDFSDAQIAAEGTWWYRVRAVDTSGNAGAWSAADSDALSRVKADHIAAAAITAVHVGANEIITNSANIKNATITSAKIVNLDGIVITGNTIRTAASGARCQMDSVSGYQAYNAAEVQTFSVEPSGAGYIGVAAPIAWNTAGGVTVDGSVLVAGTVVATAFSNVIGMPIFTALNGLALWGPGCEMAPAGWTSTRGHVAALTGAFHQEQSAWSDRRGPVIESGCTNLVLNPSAGVNHTDWWSYANATSGRSTTEYMFDGASFAVISDGTGSDGPMMTRATAVASPVQDTRYVFSAWVKAGTSAIGNTIQAIIRETGGATATELTVGTATLTANWKRIWVAHTVLRADRTALRVDLRMLDTTTGHSFRADGLQLETTHLTTTAIGSMDWCSWSGTAHNSTSVRAANTLLAPVSGTINAAAGTIVVRFKLHDLVNTAGAVLWCAGNANSEMDARVIADGSISYRINGSVRCTSAAGSVVANRWHRAAFTWHVASDESRLYLDGVLVATGTCGGSWTLDTYLGIGYTRHVGTALNLHGVMAEIATFSRDLSDEEEAAVNFLNDPLVDAGAFDVPGVYIQDGRFRLYSSQTGARTEIDVSGIRAYSAAAQSVHIKTTGDVLFGSNITAPSSTALAVFATSQTYNAEALGAGDVLFGDNSAGKANLLWDVSDGLLRFRGGTTTQVYIATDGALMAGGGAIKISSAANVLFSVASANQGLAWFSDTDFSTVSGYINVATSTGVMTIATGGPSWGTAPDMRFDLLSSAGGGSTWTAIYIDASDKEVRINGGSGATLSVRNNGDGAWSALYAQQVSNDRAVAHFDQDHATAPILRLDGPWDAAEEKSLGGYFKVNVNGTNRWVPYYV